MPPSDRETRTVRAYARALERALTRLNGRPVVFSERDWELATRWHGRGIPLGAVLEALEAKRRPPRNLAAVARAVEEEWRVIEAGRSEPAGPAGPAAGSAREAARRWAAAIEVLPAGDPLRRLIERLLTSIDRGTEPEAIDRELDHRLIEVAPAALREEASAEVDRVLAPYRSRMPPGERERTRRRAIVERLRRTLRLPRLSSGATDRF